MSDTNTDVLESLLKQLEEAVRSGNRERILQLSQSISQRLNTLDAERDEGERRLRALVAQFEEDRLRLVSLDPNKLAAAASGGTDTRERELFPVWFGTNRKPAESGVGFTSERHTETTLGRVLVHVPEAHRFGETGNGFWKRLLRLELRDDRLRVHEIAARGRDAFFAELQDAVKTERDSGSQPHALVLLHGYNVSFEQAAIGAAQIGYDLKVPGPTAFFSWPSHGRVVSYPADEATIEASERALTEFLIDFTRNCGADQVHVLAHSMGNRGLLRALQRIAARAEAESRVSFGQVVLAAPDVDRDLFLDLARHFKDRCKRATLYASRGDKAVHISAKLHAADRAGYFPRDTVAAGFDTVAVPDFNIDFLGHGYFAQAEALLSDIYDLIRNDVPPKERKRIRPIQRDGQSLWEIYR